MLTLFCLAQLYKLANLHNPKGPEQKTGKFGQKENKEGRKHCGNRI